MNEFQKIPESGIQNPTETIKPDVDQNYLDSQKTSNEKIKQTTDLIANLDECGDEYANLMQQFNYDQTAVETYLLNNGNRILSQMENPNTIRNEVLTTYVTQQFSRTHPQYEKSAPPLRGELDEPWEVLYKDNENFEKDPVLEVLPRLDNEDKPKTYLITPPLGAGAPYFIKFFQTDPAHRPFEGEFRRVNEYNLAFAKQPVLKNGSLITDVKNEKKLAADNAENIMENYPHTAEQQNEKKSVPAINAYRFTRNEVMQNIKSHEEIRETQQENIELPTYASATRLIIQINEILQINKQENLESIQNTERPAEFDQSPGVQTLQILTENLKILIQEKENKPENTQPDKDSSAKLLKICAMFYDLCSDILKSNKQTKKQTETQTPGINEETLFSFSEEESAAISENELLSITLNEDEETIYEQTAQNLKLYIQNLTLSEKHFSFDQKS